jgi:hypothetical protein
MTADFAYIRWLGDRKGIEEVTQQWDHLIVDREREMEMWIPLIRQLLKRGLRILGFFNNHYAGFTPGSIKLFWDVWERLPLEQLAQSGHEPMCRSPRAPVPQVSHAAHRSALSRGRIQNHGDSRMNHDWNS